MQFIGRILLVSNPTYQYVIYMSSKTSPDGGDWGRGRGTGVRGAGLRGREGVSRAARTRARVQLCVNNYTFTVAACDRLGRNAYHTARYWHVRLRSLREIETRARERERHYVNVISWSIRCFHARNKGGIALPSFVSVVSPPSLPATRCSPI